MERAERQRSEQYFTSSHTVAHFFRHANGRPHRAQGFDGRSDFLTILGIAKLPSDDRALTYPQRTHIQRPV